ncbi:hypothetical protein EOL70_12380 [Leucothrix sargassi]|nr:hypothetical protein EOL70_12380 [Leucothrix sargassi]
MMKLLPLVACSALILQGCNRDSDEQLSANAPKQMTYVGPAVYEGLMANPTAATLFGAVQQTVVATGGTGELCDVTINRMSYDTVGGSGEAATSSGVMMVPKGDSELCSGPRPVVVYAHGTNTDIAYDLSQFVLDPSNPAATESVLLLAMYASQGYVVVAPNYAGYSDSDLGYHPYLDQVQQSTEMIDALDHAREFAGKLGAELSSDLFVSGMSQGGYVAMATHKALEAKGETVTASLPMSGPYATLSFMDTVFAGYVNGGATTFAPMLLTALDRANDIYTDPSEVYAEQYADFADNSLPRPGGFDDAGLPEVQLFSGEPPAGAQNTAAFGEDHLLADAFRAAYLTDAATNGAEPQYQIRSLIAEADLRDEWSPSSPLLMCGASSDPVVYHATNSDGMATHWSDLVAAGLVINLDLTDEPVAGYPFAGMQQAWQSEEIALEDIHSQTSVYCSLAGVAFFNSLKGS